MSIERKVQEALALGVPMRDINRVLQNNAMKAKDEQTRSRLMNAGGAVRKFNGGSVSFGPGRKPNVHIPAFKKGPVSWDPGGPIGGPGAGARDQALAARNAKAGAAMTAGGLRTVGGVQQNLAGGIGQAGLNNRAFTPTSSLEGVAGGVEGRGAAEAAYQGELSGIAKDEQSRADAERIRQEDRAQAVEDRDYKADREDKKLSDKKELEAKDKRAVYTEQVDYAKNAIAELGKGAGEVINFAISPAVTKLAKAAAVAETRVSGLKEGVSIDKVTSGYIEDAINNFYGAQSSQLKSYYGLRQLANELRVLARKKIAGQGQVTEGEADVVYNTVFGFDQPADSVASNLQSLMNRAAKQAMIPQQTIPYSSIPSFTSTVTADDLGFTSIGDKFEDTASAAKAKFKEITGVKGSGTKEDPYRTAVTTKRPTIRTEAAAVLKWIDKKDLDEAAYISWKDRTGTVAQIIEVLNEIIASGGE